MLDVNAFKRRKTSKSRQLKIVTKFLQIALAICTFVAIKTFKTESIFEVSCNLEEEWNSTISEPDQDLSQEHQNSTLVLYEREIKITINYPFKSQSFQLPVNCSPQLSIDPSEHSNSTELDVEPEKFYHVHPDKCRPAHFVASAAIISAIYSFLTIISYFDRMRAKSKVLIGVELASGSLLIVIWLIASIWFTMVVSEVKYFTNYAHYFTDICRQSNSDCFRVLDANWNQLYVALGLTFVNALVWFAWTSHLFFADSTVLCKQNIRFMQIQDVEFQTDSQTTIATIDKLEF